MDAPPLPRRHDVAALIDHTLLRPDATADEVRALAAEAGVLGVFAVCVSPSLAAVARPVLPTGVKLATVCGFPSGAQHAGAKAHEAQLAVLDRVDEIDMVIDLGRAKAGDWAGVEREITMVRASATRALLKVIIESAALTPDEIVLACKACEAGGAEFVKTSTGFHPAGGASVEAVRLMSSTVGGRLGVKASGGIRTAQDAAAMLAAGATRLGCSASKAILDALPD